eukprot:gnl/Trimastix_PCT/893.p1 GENE.gnl/Trimastix_PCT/893~~gnl/Trimastix_PCT/893.p1  ORF type:complete len:473 (-),score=147.88 gnl/Trimastix_PCT/893:56-1474(-)
MEPQIAVIGLGTMGTNLARNAARKGIQVALYNRNTDKTLEAYEKYHDEGNFIVCRTPEEIKQALRPPRILILMVTAGPAVDAVLKVFGPHLEGHDIIIDGGNSQYRDTERRIAEMKARGICFIGMGISGGEEGALHGPSMMPGGCPDVWREHLRPILDRMAAEDGLGGRCVTWLGPGGAGHLVKTVHNGIEYALMQSLAESYQILRKAGLRAPQLHSLYTEWNREGSLLQSFLMEITGKIFRKRDDQGSDAYLVDLIRPRARSKGTGEWTIMAGLRYHAVAPTIAAALDARHLSATDALQQVALHPAGEAPAHPAPAAHADLAALMQQALELVFVLSYIQGFEILKHASEAEGWQLPMDEVARIWRGGCIIRSALLGPFQRSFKEHGTWAAPEIAALATPQRLAALKRVVSLALEANLAVPCLTTALTYYLSLVAPDAPQNLVQAQRDFFGAHTFERVDRLEGEVFHALWEQ